MSNLQICYQCGRWCSIIHSTCPNCCSKSPAKPIYRYKDFVTGKPKWTTGTFAGWQRMGLLNAPHAIFHNRASTIYVPHYCLTKETQEMLRLFPAEADTPPECVTAA